MQPQPPSPSSVKLDPPRPFVRRLRPGAVALLLSLLAALIASTLLIGLLDGTRLMERPAETSPHGRGSERQVSGGPFGGLPTDYTFATEPKPLPPEPPPAPPPAPPATPDPELLKRLELLRRELQQALDSPPVFTTVRARALVNDEVPDSEEKSERPATDEGADAPESRQAGNLSFLRQAGSVDTRVQARLEPPRSPYELQAGAVIPGALLTAINSDLPGTILGHVTENVYDSVTGRHLLIPQGARLLGAYNSEVLNGQNRILIVWQRLILPNGEAIVLEGMPGVDSAGAAGLHDGVDYHPARLTAAVLLSTVIAYTGNLTRTRHQRDDDLSIVGETLAQESARVGLRIIDRELDLPPTITIRPGWPFQVLVHKDLPLRPYRRRR